MFRVTFQAQEQGGIAQCRCQTDAPTTQAAVGLTFPLTENNIHYRWKKILKPSQQVSTTLLTAPFLPGKMLLLPFQSMLPLNYFTHHLVFGLWDKPGEFNTNSLCSDIMFSSLLSLSSLSVGELLHFQVLPYHTFWFSFHNHYQQLIKSKSFTSNKLSFRLQKHYMFKTKRCLLQQYGLSEHLLL